MKNNGIEDILINRDYNKKKKKSKKFLFLFFILVLILLGFIGTYMYLTRDIISSKELFIQNVSKININKLLENEIYANIIDKIQKESSQIESSINFTTDLENEELQDIDITKFKLDVSSLNDITRNKHHSEAILNYSGNEVLKLNLIAAENEIAIDSNEVFDKYVGLHFDKLKLKDVFEFDFDIDMEKIKEINSAPKIDLTKDELYEYTKKYFGLVLNELSEEKFSVQENIAIENATEDVEVTNYSLTLNQEELKTILIKSLEELKNDDELIDKLVTKADNIKEENVDSDETDSDKANSEGKFEDQNEINDAEENLEPEIPVIKINPVGTINTEETTTEKSNDETEENDVSETTNVQIIPVTNTNAKDETIENKENEDIETIETTDIDVLIKQENNIIDQLTTILCGKKVDLNKEQFKLIIDKLIKDIEKMSGNGIKINIYASENRVEKINLVLPNNDIIDFDFFPDENPELNSNQNYIKMTYLNEDDNSEKNGFSLEIKREQSDASTISDLEYNFIENKKINKKVKLHIKTKGTINSKELKNDIVITLSTNKFETQVAIDNKIQFKEVSDLPGINTENCIYLDLLPESERKNLLDSIKTQLITLYTNKKDNLKFIDTNTYSQITLENQNSSQNHTVTREEAKNALINRVSNMMQEAIDKNEDFTLQNLIDLKIDGYKVSSAVTSESALIVVDVYKFNIDTSFTLTDIE